MVKSESTWMKLLKKEKETIASLGKEIIKLKSHNQLHLEGNQNLINQLQKERNLTEQLGKEIVELKSDNLSHLETIQELSKQIEAERENSRILEAKLRELTDKYEESDLAIRFADKDQSEMTDKNQKEKSNKIPSRNMMHSDIAIANQTQTDVTQGQSHTESEDQRFPVVNHQADISNENISSKLQKTGPKSNFKIHPVKVTKFQPLRLASVYIERQNPRRFEEDGQIEPETDDMSQAEDAMDTDNNSQSGQTKFHEIYSDTPNQILPDSAHQNEAKILSQCDMEESETLVQMQSETLHGTKPEVSTQSEPGRDEQNQPIEKLNHESLSCQDKLKPVLYQNCSSNSKLKAMDTIKLQKLLADYDPKSALNSQPKIVIKTEQIDSETLNASKPFASLKPKKTSHNSKHISELKVDCIEQKPVVYLHPHGKNNQHQSLLEATPIQLLQQKLEEPETNPQLGTSASHVKKEPFELQSESTVIVTNENGDIVTNEPIEDAFYVDDDAFVDENGELDRDGGPDPLDTRVENTTDDETMFTKNSIKEELVCDQEKKLRQRVRKKQKARIQCPKCPKKFFSENNYYNSHLRSHGVEGIKISRACDVCGKTFTTESYLKIHREICSGVKKHQCRICSKGFGRERLLQDHMRLHTGETPFDCALCTKKFRSYSTLINHVRNRHNIKHVKEYKQIQKDQESILIAQQKKSED
eukprot:TRINITY_DN7122_c0_g1_i9.p1 TRINITY_DN7122_c0_g1~~TRINITY_DN7122_c0_g1_i9.p1  ORF type:complete len:702 (-),score=112.31 TRINITY_DN7122_c0_g1_i9:49-2154(-)